MSGEKELQKAYESILGQHFEEAAAWFQKAIEQDPDNADYHYKLSITYARSGRLDEALATARRALALRPDRSDYAVQVRMLESRQLAQRAEKLLEQEGGAAMAAALLQQALRLDPLEERAYLLLATAYARTNEFKQAIAALQKLLELDPSHEHARAMLQQYKQLFVHYLEEHP